MCFSPGSGEIFTGKLQTTARPIVRVLILSATWLLLGCNKENQSANNVESSTVEVNRKTKASKLAFRSASDSKVDRITGSISSSTLHQLIFSAISNEKNIASIPSGSENW